MSAVESCFFVAEKCSKIVNRDIYIVLNVTTNNKNFHQNLHESLVLINRSHFLIPEENFALRLLSTIRYSSKEKVYSRKGCNFLAFQTSQIWR